MMRRTIWTILGVVMLAMVPRVAAAADVSVGASVNRSVVNVGDTLYLEVHASVDANTGIRVAAKPGIGSAFRIVATGRRPKIVIRNGNAQRSLQLTYRLQALEKGTYQLAPGAFVVDGQRYEPDPKQIRVVASGTSKHDDRQAAPGTPGPQARTRNGNVMLTSSVEPTRKPYLGQQITLTYSLMHNPHRTNVDPSPPDEPSLENFWIEELSRKLAGRSRMRRMNGRPMKSTILRAYALFPLEDGKLTIDPLGVDVRTGGLFGGGNASTLKADPIEIDVQPLPSGAPANFYEGNVGSWDFRVDVDQVSSAVGGSITVELIASGTGNVRRLELPPLEDHLDGFHVSNRSTDVNKRFSGTRVAGRKKTTYTLMPTREGKLEIPSITFTYFDPHEASYRTIESRAQRLRVRGGKLPDGFAEDGSPSGQSDGDEKTDERNPKQKLRQQLAAPIRTPETTSSTTIGRPVFWLAAGIPLLVIVFLLASGPLGRRLRRSKFDKRRRKSFRRAADRLDEADPTSSDQTSDAARDALRIALVEGLDLPAGALSSDDLEEHLERTGCPQELRRELAAIMSWCESSRYAPGSRSDEMETEDWLEKTRSALERLEKLHDAGRITAISRAGIALLATFLLVLPAPALAGGDSSEAEQFDRALQLHDAEKYQQAADAWAKLTDESGDRPIAWHNYALSLVQLDRIGEARLALERAAMLAPHDDAVAESLADLRRLVALERLERAPNFERAPSLEAELDWWRLAASTSRFPLEVATVILLWLLAIGLAIRKFAEYTLTRSLGTLLAAAGLVGMLATTAGWIARNRILQTTDPAVLVDSVTARQAPSKHASSQTLAPPLVPGTMVRVYRWREGWVKIGALNGKRAWLPERALRRVEHEIQ